MVDTLVLEASALCVTVRVRPGAPNIEYRKRKNMSNIEVQVKSITSDMLGVQQSDISNEMSFVRDLGADSLDAVELILAFEDAFNVEISDDDAVKLTTVQDVIDFVTSVTAK